jgi:hypothetical protein
MIVSEKDFQIDGQSSLKLINRKLVEYGKNQRFVRVLRDDLDGKIYGKLPAPW